MCKWALLVEDYETVGTNLYYTECNKMLLSSFHNVNICPNCGQKVVYGRMNKNESER